MKPIVDALNDASNLALWIIQFSGDKQIIQAARNVVEKSNLACDRIIELRGKSCQDIASIPEPQTINANAPIKP